MARRRLTTSLGLVVAMTAVLGLGCSSNKDSTASPSATSATSVNPTRPKTAVPVSHHAVGPSTGCKARSVVKPGTTDLKITAGGVPRAYELDVPASYDGTKPYAIVFGLHALTVNYTFVPSMTGFADMAPKYDFIGVAPSGRLNGPTPYWNAAPVADNYDVAFLGKLLDHLESTLCIDTAHVFSTGMSNGAQMSSLLACRMPERITAIAAVSGVEFLEPCNGAPVPIMAFHGTADPILPYAGGGLNATAIASQQYYKGKLPAGLPKPLGVDESMRRWARHNGCAPNFVDTRISHEVRKRTWQKCKAATVLYIVDGGGHAWPGKPVPQFEKQFGHATTDIDASTLMFQFFFDRKS